MPDVPETRQVFDLDFSEQLMIVLVFPRVPC